MATFDPGAIRFRLIIGDPEMAAALRPYVEKYCAPKQLARLEPGKRVSLDIPSPVAAAELYPLIFAHGTPERLAQLKALIQVNRGTPPKLDIQDSTDIGWLFMEQYENPLRRGGINRVGDLTSRTEADLYQIINVSIKAVAHAKKRLAEHGLSLKADLEEG